MPTMVENLKVVVPSVLTGTGDSKSTSSSTTSTGHYFQAQQSDQKTCEDLLAEAEMFKKVPPPLRTYLASQMTPRMIPRNENLLKQDEPSDRFYLLESGEIRRTRINPEDGKLHHVKFAYTANSINSMRILSGEPVFATVKCVSEKCKVYEMTRSNFLKSLQAKPEITGHIIEGLCDEIRRGSRKYATPLLEQHQQEVNIPAVSIAAGIESYYRSALNAMLNARLTGVMAELFPNMHIQVPLRVAYITGFKGMRGYMDHHIDPDQSEHPTAVRLATAVCPGIIMTPISSILEASNAGHMNPEGMMTRWMRGLLPRAGREVIFGLGLNQMSDYCEERLTPHFPDHPMLANAAGSLTAGVISGYVSHVPHNLSTLKLLEPQLSYGKLYRKFVDKSVPPLVESLVQALPLSTHSRSWTRTLFATFFPRGVMIRTTQIVGSFVILNGTINYLQLKEHHKIQRALGAPV